MTWPSILLTKQNQRVCSRASGGSAANCAGEKSWSKPDSKRQTGLPRGMNSQANKPRPWIALGWKRVLMSIMGAASADGNTPAELGAPAGKPAAKFKCGIFRQRAGVVIEGCEPMEKRS